MTNSSPWYRWPIYVDDFPSYIYKLPFILGIFHGELFIITRWYWISMGEWDDDGIIWFFAWENGITMGFSSIRYGFKEWEAPIMSMIFTCSRQPFTSGSSQLCLQQFLVNSIPAKLRKVWHDLWTTSHQWCGKPKLTIRGVSSWPSLSARFRVFAGLTTWFMDFSMEKWWSQWIDNSELEP